jgi:hypothetical protein
MDLATRLNLALAIRKQVTPYPWDTEVAPGLLAVETAGHTPGHTS